MQNYKRSLYNFHKVLFYSSRTCQGTVHLDGLAITWAGCYNVKNMFPTSEPKPWDFLKPHTQIFCDHNGIWDIWPSIKFGWGFFFPSRFQAENKIALCFVKLSVDPNRKFVRKGISWLFPELTDLFLVLQVKRYECRDSILKLKFLITLRLNFPYCLHTVDYSSL